MILIEITKIIFRVNFRINQTIWIIQKILKFSLIINFVISLQKWQFRLQNQKFKFPGIHPKYKFSGLLLIERRFFEKLNLNYQKSKFTLNMILIEITKIIFRVNFRINQTIWIIQKILKFSLIINFVISLQKWQFRLQNQKFKFPGIHPKYKFSGLLLIERRFFEKLNLNYQKSNASVVNWEKV